MSCDCSGCQRGRRIGELRAKQSEGKCRKLVPRPVRKNPTSRKILLDRYKSASAWLKLQIKWYAESHERRKKSPPNTHAPYVYYFPEPITRKTWGVRKYNEARAACKKAGLLV